MALFGKKQVKGGDSGQETRWVRLGQECDILRLFMEKDQNVVPWTSPAFRAYDAVVTKVPLEFLVPPKERIEARIVHVRGGGRASMHGFHLVLQTGGRENLRRLTGVEGVNADHFTPELIQRAEAAAKARVADKTQPPRPAAPQQQPQQQRQPVAPHTPQPPPTGSRQPPGSSGSQSTDLGDFGEFSEAPAGETTAPSAQAPDESEYLGGDIGELGPTEEEFQSYMASGRAPGEELPDEVEASQEEPSEVVEEAELVELDDADHLGEVGDEDLGGSDQDLGARTPEPAVPEADSELLAPPGDDDHPFAGDADSPFEEESNPFDAAEPEEAEPIEDVEPIEEPEPVEEPSEPSTAPADEDRVLVPPEEELALEPEATAPDEEDAFAAGPEPAGDEEDPFAALDDEPADLADETPDSNALSAPPEEIEKAAEPVGLAGGEDDTESGLSAEASAAEQPAGELADEAVHMAEEVAAEPMSGHELDAEESEKPVAVDEADAEAGEAPAPGAAGDSDQPEVAHDDMGWGAGEGAEAAESPVGVDEGEPVAAESEEPVAVDEEEAPSAPAEEPASGEPEMAARFAHDDAQYLEGIEDEAPSADGDEEDEIADAEEEAVGLGDEEIVDAEEFMRDIQDDEAPSDERYSRVSSKEDIEAAIAEAERLAGEAGNQSTIVTRSPSDEMPSSVLPQGADAIGRASDTSVKEVQREQPQAEAFIDIAGDDEIKQALDDAGEVVMTPVEPGEQPERPSGNFEEPEAAEDEPIGMAEDEPVAVADDEPVAMAEEESPESEAAVEPEVAPETADDEPVAMAEEEVDASEEEPAEEPAQKASEDAGEEYDWLPFTKEQSDALKLAAKNAGVEKKLPDRLVFKLSLRVRFPDGEEAQGTLCLYEKRPALMQDESEIPRHLTRDCSIAYL